MTQAQLEKLLDSMRPVPLIMLQCGTPQSQRENANMAWKALGKELGFDYMTVRPNGQGDRCFNAEEVPS